MLFEVIFRMTDFMKWLYPRYIRPYLDDVPAEEWDWQLDLLRNELPPDLWPTLEQVRERTAIHAFLLGLRTGAGLAGISPP